MPSIVLIDSDPDGMARLSQQLSPLGRLLTECSSVEEAQESLQSASLEAVVMVLEPERGEEPTPLEVVRKVACWARAAGQRPCPALIVVGRQGLAAETMVDVLHRGAHVVVTPDQLVAIREVVEAQLFARANWMNGGYVIDLNEGSSAADNNATASIGEERGEDYEVVPRLRHAADTLAHEPGWIPRPSDFTITESDPIDLKFYESKAVLRAIAATDGNRTLAAELLGIGKSTLYRRLSEWRASLT